MTDWRWHRRTITCSTARAADTPMVRCRSEVMTNITSMAHRNRGRARYFPVTTLSTFSLRVSSPGFCPLVTEAATTRSMYW